MTIKNITWRNVDTWDDVIVRDIEDLIWTLLIEAGKDPAETSFDIVVRYKEKDPS